MILGPLTFVKEGWLTLYGVVSGVGEKYDGECRRGALYFRVATPDAIDWIESWKKRVKFEKPLLTNS